MKLLLLACVAAGLVADQIRPSFAGRWIGGAPMANLVGVVGPQEMTITQDASSLKIERPYGRNRVTISVRLDGSESKNSPAAGAGASGSVPRELISKAAWEGAKLKITTIVSVPDGTSGGKRDVTTIETLSVDGDSLIVERSDEAIGPGPGQVPVRPEMFKSSKLIYKRSN